MADLRQYKCPNCGGRIEFNSGAQKMVCPYCDTTYDVDEFLAQFGDETQGAQAGQETGEVVSTEQDADWQMEASEWNTGEDGLLHYVCQSCGGEIVADANTAATRCPYCDNPVTVAAQMSGTLRPDLLIPFALDKKAAKEKYKQHIADKKLLPRIFSAENHIDEIQGVYVPFWLFDAKVDANFVFNASRVASRHRQGDYDVVETDHFQLQRSGRMEFSGVPTDGSTRMDDDLMDSIEPFYLTAAVDFAPAYLAGYLAERYDVTAEDSFERARQRIHHSAETAMRQSVAEWPDATVAANHTRITEGSVRYAFYPVWLLNTTYNGQKYVFAMNGQTGKFVGDLPCDNSLYWKYVLKRLALIGAGVFAALAGLHFFL